MRVLIHANWIFNELDTNTVEKRYCKVNNWHWCTFNRPLDFPRTALAFCLKFERYLFAICCGNLDSKYPIRVLSFRNNSFIVPSEFYGWHKTHIHQLSMERIKTDSNYIYFVKWKNVHSIGNRHWNKKRGLSIKTNLNSSNNVANVGH